MEDGPSETHEQRVTDDGAVYSSHKDEDRPKGFDYAALKEEIQPSLWERFKYWFQRKLGMRDYDRQASELHFRKGKHERRHTMSQELAYILWDRFYRPELDKAVFDHYTKLQYDVSCDCKYGLDVIFAIHSDDDETVGSMRWRLNDCMERLTMRGSEKVWVKWSFAETRKLKAIPLTVEC